ncbi:MAG: DNA polymerase Y family protein, partial [Chitinophagaceae bacterium]
MPFAMITQERNRQIIVEASKTAQSQGLRKGMLVADARITFPDLETFKYEAEIEQKLLNELAQSCIKYSPQVSIDTVQGLFLNIFGCTHIWNDEAHYIKDITAHFKEMGYQIKVCIADTMASAWAMAHYGKSTIITSNEQTQALLALPPKALRLEEAAVQRLSKLGFNDIESFIDIAPSVLKRRFGNELILKLNQALGVEPESFSPINESSAYQVRLPSLEPIRTANGIEIAIQTLLETLCNRLKNEGLGIRSAFLKCYRVDGKLQQISIGTNQATINITHLFRLFELRISKIRPDLGIELFVLEADNVEELTQEQKAIWHEEEEASLNKINELLDFISIRAGKNGIRRYLPEQHHWPENSIKASTNLALQPENEWPIS